MANDTLLYDGECPMCALGARLAGKGGLRTLPLQAAGVPVESCAGEMRLVAGGRIETGADALRAIFRRRWWTWPLSWLVSVWSYQLISRNRRAITPTAANVRLPRSYYGETAGWILAFVLAGTFFSTLVTLAYGITASGLMGIGAMELTLSAAVGWAVSLPLLGALVRTSVEPHDFFRHVVSVMVTGVLPLIPLSVSNLLEPSLLANAAVLLCDGALMLVCMVWRLGLYGVAPWRVIVWFAALEAGGLSVVFLSVRNTSLN